MELIKRVDDVHVIAFMSRHSSILHDALLSGDMGELHKALASLAPQDGYLYTVTGPYWLMVKVGKTNNPTKTRSRYRTLAGPDMDIKFFGVPRHLAFQAETELKNRLCAHSGWLLYQECFTKEHHDKIDKEATAVATLFCSRATSPRAMNGRANRDDDLTSTITFDPTPQGLIAVQDIPLRGQSIPLGKTLFRKGIKLGDLLAKMPASHRPSPNYHYPAILQKLGISRFYVCLDTDIEEVLPLSSLKRNKTIWVPRSEARHILGAQADALLPIVDSDDVDGVHVPN
jgi:hypothetical protein